MNVGLEYGDDRASQPDAADHTSVRVGRNHKVGVLWRPRLENAENLGLIRIIDLQLMDIS